MEEGVGEVGLDFTGDLPKPKRKFSGYDPTETDFIRRCKTVDEAREIINYLESRREISSERAEELRTLLDEKGLRSFGRKKAENYYENEG